VKIEKGSELSDEETTKALQSLLNSAVIRSNSMRRLDARSWPKRNRPRSRFYRGIPAKGRFEGRDYAAVEAAITDTGASSVPR